MSIGLNASAGHGVATIRRARVDGPSRAPGVSPPLYSILATACIAPPAYPGLQRMDPDIRMGDYLSALATIAVLDDARLGPLVMLENSGMDPDRFIDDLLASMASRPLRRSIEVISYTAPPRPLLMHYGYSEFQMIDLLMDHSTLLASHFVKVTGRYRFPALSRLLDHVPVPPAWLCDAQDIPSILGRNASRTTSTALFIASRAFYDRRIRHLYREMQQRPRFTHVENLIYDELRPEHGFTPAVSLRFPVNCEAAGVGGNGDTLAGIGRRTRSSVRGLARRVAPRLWL